MIVLGDPPEAWEALGFDVRDGIVALGEERLQLTGRGGGILEVTAHVEAEEPDGLPLRNGALHPREPSAHPNGAFVIDHVVALTGSLDRTVAALEDAGLDLRRRDERMAFLRLGPYILEVVERGGDPARFWGLVVVVDDPGAVPGAGPAKNAVQPGPPLGSKLPGLAPSRRIATVKGLGTALAVMSRRV